MECKKINSELLRTMLGLDELSPAQAAIVQGGDLNGIYKYNSNFDDVMEEDMDYWFI